MRWLVGALFAVVLAGCHTSERGPSDAEAPQPADGGDQALHSTLSASRVFLRVDQPLAVGQSARVVVVLRNAGSSAWTGGSVDLVETSSTSWGVAAMALPAGTVVAPNEVHAFAFRVTAPPLAGVYTMSWQLEDHGQRFGDVVTATVAVVNGPTYAIRGADPFTPGCYDSPQGALSCSNCIGCDFDTREIRQSGTVPLPWPFSYFGQNVSGDLAFTDYGTLAFGDSSDPLPGLPIPSVAGPNPLISAFGQAVLYHPNQLVMTGLHTGRGGAYVEVLWPRLTLGWEFQYIARTSIAARLYESGIIEIDTMGERDKAIPTGRLGLETPSGLAAAFTRGRRTLFLPSWTSFTYPADLLILNVDYPRSIPAGESLPLRITVMNIGETATGQMDLLGTWFPSCDFGGWTSIGAFDLAPGAALTVTATVSPTDVACLVIPLPMDAPMASANGVALDPIVSVVPDAGVDAGPADSGGPTFACGWVQCPLADTYCQIIPWDGGPDGPKWRGICTPIPAECPPQATCTCEAIRSMPCVCSGDPSIGISCDFR
ncbi:MAG: NBR1-Ig-like domain-containing protein [Myxococcota bacterium]